MENTKYIYKLYGMTIASDILFPEMDQLSKDVKVQEIDAVIQLAKPPEWVIEAYKQGSYASLSDDIMWFRLEEKLLIYVEKGTLALVWCIEPMEETVLRTYVLSGAITFLLMQRGYLPIHGSAIVYRNQAYIISGGSGSGKSTTTMKLLENDDISFATDDICAVTVQNEVNILWPGPPWQKICRDVYDREKEKEQYFLINEPKRKYGKRIKGTFCIEPIGTYALIEIVKKPVAEVVLREVHGGEKLSYIMHNLFRGELYHILGITVKRMEQFTQVASNMRVFEIIRPEQGDSLFTLVEEIKVNILQYC